ncbi:hypothetical protein [Saccharibacillus alkalitolerans]|uniref:Copper amine oxidase-like N-terminal domain-containing protein n=1 Tax=Saccharibacillus alkalitolerans TaxID=2705290 RepID=A0ABX0F973_9BACL|nr:hypothetical protein [Saccharibacillus alkalitolerans]NGZ76524.1 hypothetical protein [Saccharibacillus alkalitolerans]
MKKLVLSLLAGLLILPALSAPAIHASESSSPRTRTTTEFRYKSADQQIEVRTVEVSMDSGMKQTNTYKIANTPTLVNSGKGNIEFSGNAQTADTPSGLKAYTAVRQYNSSGKMLYSILEFDYRTQSVKKIGEHSDTGYGSVKIYAKQGIYSFRENIYTGQGIFYSLASGRKIHSAGYLIKPENITSTRYTVSPQPAEKDYLIYCSDQKQTACSLVRYGEEKGSQVKVSRSVKAEDPVYRETRTLDLDDAKIQVQGAFSKEGQAPWQITAFRGGKKTNLFQGKAISVSTHISPNRKYLVLGVATGKQKQMNLSYQIFDMKTLKLVQTYIPKYKTGPEHFRWISDDLFILDYFFSAPDAYPLEFYYIPDDLKLPIKYRPYTDWLDSGAWDNFSYENFIYPVHPAGIFSKKAAVGYSGQPAFYSDLTYYVPLKELADTFGISYEFEGNTLRLRRNEKQASLSLTGDKVLRVQDGWFVALGEWNRALGVKPAYTQNTTYNSEIRVIDEP